MSSIKKSKNKSENSSNKKKTKVVAVKREDTGSEEKMEMVPKVVKEKAVLKPVVQKPAIQKPAIQKPVIQKKVLMEYKTIISRRSFSLILTHEKYCVKMGRCFCSMKKIGQEKKRMPSSLHVVAGIATPIPLSLLNDPVIQKYKKKGLLIVKP